MTQALDQATRASSAYRGLRPYDASALAACRGAEAQDWDDLISALKADPGGATALLRALAWGLPQESLLRWACLAARLEEVASARAKRSDALISAERWLRDRDETTRYAALRLARAEGFASPATLAALAVYVSGPSLAPQDEAADPPPPGLGKSTAEGCLAAAAASEALAPDGLGRVNLIGLDLAQGGDGRRGAHEALATSTDEG